MSNQEKAADRHVVDVIDIAYAKRRWWRKFPFRWEVTLSYLLVAFAAALGVNAVQNNSQQDIDRNEATIKQIVCGTRRFVERLVDAGSDSQVILTQFDESLPRVGDCTEVLEDSDNQGEP